MTSGMATPREAFEALRAWQRAVPLHLARVRPHGAPGARDASASLCSEMHRRAQNPDRGTPMPGSIRVGPDADGMTSKSKIPFGMYTVEHELGMSTAPDSRP